MFVIVCMKNNLFIYFFFRGEKKGRKKKGKKEGSKEKEKKKTGKTRRRYLSQSGLIRITLRPNVQNLSQT